MNLLNSSEQRRLEFAEILSNSDHWMTLTELGNQLNCSVRILKDDITYFRKNFTDFEIQTSNKGVRLIYEENKGLKNLYQNILNKSSAYELLEALFMNDGIAMADLAELLFVSGSTLYRLIKQINDETSPYSFKIETNPCRITGNEENIRYFFYQYFYEKYSFTGWPFETVDKQALDKFLTFHIELTQLKNDFAYYSKFKIIGAVNLIRFKNKHYVNTEGLEVNYEKKLSEISAYADLFLEFERTLNIKYDDTLIAQLFTFYIQDSFSLNYENLMKQAANDETIASEISVISQLLERVSEENNISILNKKIIIFAMRNIIHLDYLEPQPGFVLYDRDKYFVEGVKNSFPKFYQSIYQAMKELREFLDKPLTEEGINFYIYTIFTYWRGLVPELRKKFEKIRVVVISDRHITHGRMLKDFIAHEFTEQIAIDIYTAIKLDKNILENLDCDLIVTNFPIPTLASKRTIYIENVPSFNDLVKLQKGIDTIIADRINH